MRVSKQQVSPVLIEIQERLHLNKPPHWIEGFDVSNLGDKFAVGSSVAFKDGKPYKQYYRRYRIRRIAGQDDYAMMRQIVNRRLKDLKQRKSKPGLLLIDGGKGQLSSALRVIKELDTDIPTFALAKRNDELYDAGGKQVRKSVLDSIAGIGKTRKLRILKYFGSIEALRKASETEIAKAPGIGPHTAKRIYEALHT
jgi:excinuclease ABC subunit C